VTEIIRLDRETCHPSDRQATGCHSSAPCLSHGRKLPQRHRSGGTFGGIKCARSKIPPGHPQSIQKYPSPINENIGEEKLCKAHLLEVKCAVPAPRHSDFSSLVPLCLESVNQVWPALLPRVVFCGVRAALTSTADGFTTLGLQQRPPSPNGPRSGALTHRLPPSSPSPRSGIRAKRPVGRASTPLRSGALSRSTSYRPWPPARSTKSSRVRSWP
jgi:hypothetical protein